VNWASPKGLVPRVSLHGEQAQPDDHFGRERLEQLQELARPKGLEPLTGGLEIHCSIQLSYGRVWALGS
jgi:hypothetical protein